MNIKIKAVYGIMIGFALMAFFAVSAPVNVSAYSGTVYGRDNLCGYFTGDCYSGYGDSVLPKIYDQCPDGLPLCAIPDYVDNVDKFVQLLKDAYNNQSPTDNSGDLMISQRRTGAAFIVNTLLGRDAPGDYDISGDWGQVTTLLNSSNISWHEANLNNSDGTDCVNSMYFVGTDGADDAFYSNSSSCYGDRTGIKVSDTSGNTIYRIWRECANPIGRQGGWSITPTASVNTPTATPGQTVTWTHTIKNNGPGSTDENVAYYYQNSNATGNLLGNRVPASNSPLVPSRSGATSSSTSTSTAPSSGTICRVTIAVPKSSISADPIQSAPACVSVSGTEPTNPCRPMLVAIQPKTEVSSPAGAGGGYVPVKVWTTIRTLGTYSVPTRVDVTKDHTTGDQYVVNFKETRHWVSSWNTIAHHHYQAPTTYTYTPNYSPARSWTTGPIGPCFDYKLTAGLTTSGSYQVEVNSIVQITPTLTSASYTYTAPEWNSFVSSYSPKLQLHTKTKTTEWQINQLTVSPNLTVPTLANPSTITPNPTPKKPCDYFQSNGPFVCSTPVLKIGSANAAANGQAAFKVNGAYSSGNNPFSTYNVTIGDYPSGTRVCFAFSVHAATSEPKNNLSTLDPTAAWDHSAINGARPEIPCVIVVKKPKTQVLGGDLSVGKPSKATPTPANANVATTTSVKNISGNHVFGSWVEYGIFATGSIKGTASGSAFAGSSGMAISTPTPSICSYSTLSFANTVSSPCDNLGSYNWQGHLLPDVTNSFPVPASASKLSSGSLDNVQGVHSTNGNVTITGGAIKKGQWIVINAPTADITITGDIKYTNGTLNSINDIPQVVIIAKNINITASVKNIDAWLVANSGSINTCSDQDKPNGLTAQLCVNKLTVNGPVIAKQLFLRRTAGSGTGAASGDPAETFNLRADAYLWAYARATGSGRVQTVYTTELPPRL